MLHIGLGRGFSSYSELNKFVEKETLGRAGATGIDLIGNIRNWEWNYSSKPEAEAARLKIMDALISKSFELVRNIKDVISSRKAYVQLSR